MNAPSPHNTEAPAWFTSSYSNGAGGECVECAIQPTGMLIRDSKRAGGPIVHAGTVQWAAFVRAAAYGELG